MVLGVHRPGPRRLKTGLVFYVSPGDKEVTGGCSIYGVGVGVDSKLPSSTAEELPGLYKPLPSLSPSKWHSFRLGSVQAPTWSLLEVPPPPKFFLLTQKDFCLGAG